MDVIYKKPEDRCPDGYHVVDDDTICVPCSRICYENMGQFTAENCKRICPSVYNSLLDNNSVPRADDHESSLPLWQLVMIVSCLFAFVVFVVVCSVRCSFSRRTNRRLSFWRWLFVREKAEVHDARPVQEKSPDIKRAELVPSGR